MGIMDTFKIFRRKEMVDKGYDDVGESSRESMVLSEEEIEKYIDLQRRESFLSNYSINNEVFKVLSRDVEEWRREIRRPVASFLGNMKVNFYKVPMVPYGFRFYYDLFFYSSILNVVVRALVDETFRNGLYVAPKWRWKCSVCGATYNEEKPDVCEICGNTTFLEPDRWEKLQLQKFLENPVNKNDQTLKDVLKEIDYDLNVLDNAWLVVTKRYYFKDGKIIGQEPIEVLRGDPNSLFLIMDMYGNKSLTDNGEIVLTCPKHRTEYRLIPYDDYLNGKIPKCPKCGKEMVPAVAVHVKTFENADSKMFFYIDGEVLHIKKFYPGFGYGVPPVLTVLIKVLTLMKMDYYIYMAYSLQRPPRGILLIKGNAQSVKKAYDYMLQKTYENPHNIYPIIVEADEVTAKAKLVEWVDLSYRASDFSLIDFRNQLRREIGARWGVEPIFHGDLSTGSGLANQGLQITVMNRVVEEEQALFNDKVLRWLTKQLGYEDWIIQLRPHEEKDMMAQLQRWHSRFDLAMKARQLGISYKLKEGADGLDFIFYEDEDLKEKLKRMINDYAKQNNLGQDWVKQMEQLIDSGNVGQAMQGLQGGTSSSGAKVVGVVGEGGEVEPSEITQEAEESEEEYKEDRDANARMERPEGAPDGWASRMTSQGYGGQPELKRKERKDKGQKRNPEEKEGKDTRAEIYNWLKEEGVL